MSATADSRAWRIVFLALAAGSLVLMVTVSFDYGVNGDEILHEDYGESVWRYYRSGLADKSALHFGSITYVYGALYEIVCALARRVSPLFRYDTRHVLNSAVGWLGMIYAARCAGLLGGPRAASIALVLMLASPYYFGHSMNNSKDIPFATGYIASVYYLMRIGPEWPFATPTLFAKIAAAITCAIGIRFGGLILIIFLWMTLGAHSVRSREWRVERLAWVAGLAAITSVAALLAGTLFCPWALQKPFVRPFEALSKLSHLSDAAGIPVLFEGRTVNASQLPVHYAPKMLAITVPITVLVVGLSSMLLLDVRKKEAWPLLLLWIAFAVPVAYVMHIHAVLYSGIRHFLFVVPPFTALAAIGCERIVEWASQGGPLRWLAPIVLAGGMIDPVRFSIVNHPHQVVYFNPLVGGLPGAFQRYEVDVWGQSSVKEAVRWILREADVPADRAIRVSGGRWPFWVMIRPCIEQYGRLIYVGKGNPPNADFRIELLQFDPPKQREALRTGKILHVVSADGVPLCLVKAGRGWSAARGAEAKRAPTLPPAAAVDRHERDAAPN